MASLAHDRSPGCWCISTVTVAPAATAHLPAAGDVPALQAMSAEVTLVTGELLRGRRAQDEPFAGVSSAQSQLATYLPGTLGGGGEGGRSGGLAGDRGLIWSTPSTHRSWNVAWAATR